MKENILNSFMLLLVFMFLTFVGQSNFVNASELTCNLVSDTQTKILKRPTKPVYMGTYTDPVFGTKILRISGDPGTAIPNIPGAVWGNVVKHHYSKDQAWNADGSLLYLINKGGSGGEYVFLDGNTYQPKFARSEPSSADLRWHRTDPNLMVFARNGELGHWNVVNNTLTTIATFAGYKNLQIGPWEGNLSSGRSERNYCQVNYSYSCPIQDD